MSVELNHTIVAARDPQASAKFLAGILGLEVDPPLSHFTPVTLANGVTLDYDQSQDSIQSCHYAFAGRRRRSSTPRSPGSRTLASTSSPTPAARRPGKSTAATTAAGACTSATPTAT